jgi:hypothetical protein
MNPAPTWHKLSWMAEFMAAMPKYRDNTIATAQLAIESREHHFAWAQAEGIEFDHKREGILHVSNCVGLLCVDFGNGNWHPRFFGWVQGQGTPLAMLAEMLAAGMNPHLAGFNQAPPMVERQVVGWLATLMGIPGAGGLLVTGGTAANTHALGVARYAAVRARGGNVRDEGLQHWPDGPTAKPLVFYGSVETHGWARTAAEWLRPVDPLLVQTWNFTQAANGGNWSATRPPNVGNIADTVSEGWEFEGTINPTRNWRITFNAAMQEAQKSNVGSDFAEFIAKNLPLWKDGNGSLATNIRAMEGFEDITYFGSFGASQLGNLAVVNMYVPYLNALAANGSPVQELRRWRFNAVTNYDFRTGPLKGFAIGGAARWQDRVAMGFPAKQNAAGAWVYDVTKPYYGSTELDFDGWIRYGRKILNDRVRWSVQLNVRDLLGGDELIAVTAQPNGQVASARIPQPNKWTITNSFEF